MVKKNDIIQKDNIIQKFEDVLTCFTNRKTVEDFKECGVLVGDFIAELKGERTYLSEIERNELIYRHIKHIPPREYGKRPHKK